jgi:transcriptional regulator with XRE-family HTH domain
MAKLKELRIKSGMTQSQFCEKISVFREQLSVYENDLQLPELETAYLIEKTLANPVKWKENLTPARKREIIQSIVILCEHYPLKMVGKFFGRIYTREVSADSYILHYANLVSGEDIEPLLPNP